LIVAIVASVLALILVVAVAIYCIRKRNGRHPSFATGTGGKAFLRNSNI